MPGLAQMLGKFLFCIRAAPAHFAYLLCGEDFVMETVPGMTGRVRVVDPAAGNRIPWIAHGCVVRRSSGSVFFEGVFDFFAGLLQVGFDLVAFALGL